MRLYAEHLGEELARRGVDVHRVRVPDVLPASLRRLGFLDKLDSYVGRFVKYPRVAREASADVFHIADHGQGHLVSSLDPARTVVTCHDTMLLVLASGRLGVARPPRIATRVLRHALRGVARAAAIIAVSEQTRRDLAANAGIDPTRVRVVYSGLNQAYAPRPDLREPTRRRFGFGPGPLLLHVGHTGFYKNIEGCLRVVDLLRRGGLDASFAHVGGAFTGPQRALCSALGLERSVRDLGTLSDADLAAMYASADVLLFPSFYEGFGWPPLEAMASGLPVVSSRAGALDEVIGDAALTAEPADAQRLAGLVARIISDPELRRDLRARGIQRAARFSWARTAEAIEDVYREVLR